MKDRRRIWIHSRAKPETFRPLMLYELYYRVVVLIFFCPVVISGTLEESKKNVGRNVEGLIVPVFMEATLNTYSNGNSSFSDAILTNSKQL